MSERNHLSNGRFWHDLNNWDVSGAVYSAGDGDGHYGVAVLSTGGDYIEQDFSVPDLRDYTLHLSAKPTAALSAGQATIQISDGNGNTLVTLNLVGSAGAWQEQTFAVGLVPGTTYTVRITNVSATGDLKVDDAWLWFVPVTRRKIAQAVHRKLRRVATELCYDTATEGEQTEGDYTDAVDEALRSAGAINPETGLPDTRYLDEQSVKTAIDLTMQAMLEMAAIDFGVEVDVAIGPHREQLSQKREALLKLAGIGGDQGRGGGGAGNRHRS